MNHAPESKKQSEHSVAKDALFVYSAKMGALLASFLSIALMARVLSNVDFSKYLLFLNLVLVGSSLLSLGIPSMVLRLVGNNIQLHKKVQIFHILLSLAIGCVFAIYYLIKKSSNTSSNIIDLGILLSCCAFISSSNIIGSSVRSLQKNSSQYSVILAIPNLVTLINIFLFYLIGDLSYRTVTISILIASGLTWIYILTTFTKVNNKTPGSYSTATPNTNKLISCSTIFFIINFCFIYQSKIEFFILTQFSNTHTINEFGSALRLFDLIIIPIAAVGASVVSKVATQYAETGVIQKHEIKSAVRLTGRLMAAMSLTVILFADVIVYIVYGPSLTGTANYLRIMMVGVFISAPALLSTVIMNSLGEQLRVMILLTVFTIIQTLMAIPAILYFEATGALVLFTLYFIGWRLLMAFLMHKKLNLNLLSIFFAKR